MLKIIPLVFAVVLLAGCGPEPKQEPAEVPTPEVTMPSSTEYTLEEVTKHNTPGDCWTVIDGIVSDVTSFFGKHPGGDEKLAKACGADATEMFQAVKKHDPNGYKKAQELKIGTLKQ